MASTLECVVYALFFLLHNYFVLANNLQIHNIYPEDFDAVPGSDSQQRLVGGRAEIGADSTLGTWSDNSYSNRGNDNDDRDSFSRVKASVRIVKDPFVLSSSTNRQENRYQRPSIANYRSSNGESRFASSQHFGPSVYGDGNEENRTPSNSKGSRLSSNSYSRNTDNKGINIAVASNYRTSDSKGISVSSVPNYSSLDNKAGSVQPASISGNSDDESGNLQLTLNFRSTDNKGSSRHSNSNYRTSGSRRNDFSSVSNHESSDNKGIGALSTSNYRSSNNKASSSEPVTNYGSLDGERNNIQTTSNYRASIGKGNGSPSTSNYSGLDNKGSRIQSVSNYRTPSNKGNDLQSAPNYGSLDNKGNNIQSTSNYGIQASKGNGLSSNSNYGSSDNKGSGTSDYGTLSNERSSSESLSNYGSLDNKGNSRQSVSNFGTSVNKGTLSLLSVSEYEARQAKGSRSSFETSHSTSHNGLVSQRGDDLNRIDSAYVRRSEEDPQRTSEITNDAPSDSFRSSSSSVSHSNNAHTELWTRQQVETIYNNGTHTTVLRGTVRQNDDDSLNNANNAENGATMRYTEEIRQNGELGVPYTVQRRQLSPQQFEQRRRELTSQTTSVAANIDRTRASLSRLGAEHADRTPTAATRCRCMPLIQCAPFSTSILHSSDCSFGEVCCAQPESTDQLNVRTSSSEESIDNNCACTDHRDCHIQQRVFTLDAITRCRLPEVCCRQSGTQLKPEASLSSALSGGGDFDTDHWRHLQSYSATRRQHQSSSLLDSETAGVGGARAAAGGVGGRTTLERSGNGDPAANNKATIVSFPKSYSVRPAPAKSQPISSTRAGQKSAIVLQLPSSAAGEDRLYPEQRRSHSSSVSATVRVVGPGTGAHSASASRQTTGPTKGAGGYNGGFFPEPHSAPTSLSLNFGRRSDSQYKPSSDSNY